MVTRKAASTATPVLTVTVSGDHWKIKQVTTFKTYDEEFDIGVEQDKATADGRKVKVSISVPSGDAMMCRRGRCRSRSVYRAAFCTLRRRPVGERCGSWQVRWEFRHAVAKRYAVLHSATARTYILNSKI